MPGPLPTVSVVMPTRNRAQILDRCLSAVLTDEATSEAIVVVDGEDPATLEVLDRLAQQDRRVVITSVPADPAELGRVQRGRDHGVAMAGSDVVLSLDDDVEAHPGLVSGHARHHADRDDLVVVGYMPVVTPRRWPFSHAPVHEYAEAYEEMCRVFAADPGSILRQLWGGNVSVRRAHWLQAIQRPRVGSYLDDKELGLLLRQEGLEAMFDPSLSADHWYQRSLRGLVERDEKNCLAQAQLRATHPEVSKEVVDGRGRPAELDGDGSAGDLGPSAALRALHWLTRSSPGWLAVKWGLIAATSAAAVLRISTIENKGAVALSWLAWSRAERELPESMAAALQ